jgi:uncharacterized protein (UPF0548 family)
MVFRVPAFSRPGHPLVRLGAPMGRLIQLRMNKAYLLAMRQAAA